MKWLLLLLLGLQLVASGQSFPARKINDEFFASNIYNAQILKGRFHEFIRDNNGLYWFQNLTQVYSFDGVNWKSYRIRSINGSQNPMRINDIEKDDMGNIWLATEHGMYIFDRYSDCFISAQEKFPGSQTMPQGITCLFHGFNGKLIFLSFYMQGFFVLDTRSKKLVHVTIDKNVFVPTEGYPISISAAGDVWGTTTDSKGIWHYNITTGATRCSWKGELPQFQHPRFRQPLSLTYYEKDHSLWISHSTNRYIERMDLNKHSSKFFSFVGQLKVIPDSNATNRYKVFPVKIDRDNSLWVNADQRFIIRLDIDPGKMAYLCNEPETLPIGDFELFKPESGLAHDKSDVLLWTQSPEKISMIRQRDSRIEHVYFDSLSESNVSTREILSTDGRQNMFLLQHKSLRYFLLQKNAGKPKLVVLGENLGIEANPLRSEWNKYPAYFRREIQGDTVYIALLRPGIEPLDFRQVVMQDLMIDLRSLQVKPVDLSLKQRIQCYGSRDVTGEYWLFSNGYLYGYHPAYDRFDSVFICKPREKGQNLPNMIKGFDYPTALHQPSSSFWIDFFPARELYKVNLTTKRIDTVLKTCMDRRDCDIPGAAYDILSFDENSLFLKSSLYGLLLNARTSAVTDFSSYIKTDLPLETPAGCGMFNNWLCLTYPSHIFLYNTKDGSSKHLVHGEDFKWKLAALKSKPVLNREGKLVFMSYDRKGFMLVDLEMPFLRKKPGVVRFSSIKIDDRNISIDSIRHTGLELKYNRYNTIHLAFSDYSVFEADKIQYEYALYKHRDTIWNKIEHNPELTLSELSPGRYDLLIRAKNVFGDFSEQMEPLHLTILPPFWRTWWFGLLIVSLTGAIFYALYHYRLNQVRKLQVIRNNIASDLHDDIGSTLNSISIYSEVAKQQAGREIPALDLIGTNSRKIIESMSDIVWTINPENDSFEKVIVRMRSFAHQLFKAKKVEYSFEVDESLNNLSLPMQVRKNFYLVFKEAVTNVIKYSEATRVSISLFLQNKTIMFRIKDNGKGIPVNAHTQGNGLLNMSRRAADIDAELNIVSCEGGGTEIELSLKDK